MNQLIQKICLGALLLGLMLSATAVELASEAELYNRKREAFANPKQDNPNLPNVLLIGDSISIGYTPYVRRQLKGKADVYRIPTNARNSAYGLERLDKWLTMVPGKWDVIHFNWGLWDLCYRHPKAQTQGHRDKVNGTITASPEDYRANMEAIVARLKQTGAKLIWCTTTPVPENEAGRKHGDDLVYNQIAEEIMRVNGVLINDLHSHARLKLPGIMAQEGDVHYTEEGYQYLAEKVVKELTAATSKQTKEKYPWTLGYQPDQSIIFSEPAEGKPLKLDVFFPADHKVGGNQGCIIFFFGGGWSGGDTSQFYGYGKYFASRGLVAISAQYRTRGSHKASPRNCVEDGRAAIRYVRAHAKELGIDPNKIIVGGGSAGGHVAAACAMCPKVDASPDSLVSSMPNALMLFNPVYDNGPEGFGYERVSAYWEEISPMNNIRAGLPPTIAFFGDNDKHIPVATINAFQQKMVAAGNQSETHIYEGQAHGFFHINKGGRAMFEDVLMKADAFLVKNGYISGEDTVLVWTEESIAKLPTAKKKKK